MSTEGRPTAELRRTEELRSTTSEQIGAFFDASRHVAPIGNVVAGLVALSLLWGHVPHARLWTWVAVVAGLAAVQALAALNPPTTIEELVPSGVVVDSNVLAGVTWGVLPWLDIGSFGDDEVYRWICLALAFGIGAGAMGGLSVLTGIALRVQAPLYALIAAAFLVVGQPAVAIGVVVYLLLMASDIRGTSRNLRELVALRVESADRAADAETQARRDPLTGLSNRAAAFERIEELRGSLFVVMFVDLDFFKDVNDRLGHEAGDLVLVETARRIQAAMRPDDLVARLGGDEFLVVFAGDDDDLDMIGRRVLAEVERPIGIGAEEAMISASIGVTVVGEDDWTTANLLRQADHALYRAKRTGRQGIVRFDDRLADELEQRTTLEDELRDAVRAGGIEPVAQPVHALATGAVSWVELTPRWQHTTGGEVAPEVFVPLAEEIGLIEALTRSILDHAARARLRWRDHPVLGSAAVTVRVVAGHLVRGGLVDDVGSTVADHGLRPGELQLMLTETADIGDPRRAAAAIETIREMGVGIVLGEFGSGRSTLRDLIQLPIDVVTVHRGLVHGAQADGRVEKLLAAFDHVAGSLDLSVGADGVDTARQLEIVRRLGLPYAQGEALCPPRPLLELEAMVTRPAPLAANH